MAASAGPMQAEMVTASGPNWIVIGVTDDWTQVTLADPTSVEGDRSIRRIWVLVNHALPVRGALSEAGQWMIDCDQRRGEVIALIGYSRRGGRGSVVGSGTFAPSPASGWQPFPPNSVAAGIAQTACGPRTR